MGRRITLYKLILKLKTIKMVFVYVLRLTLKTLDDAFLCVVVLE